MTETGQREDTASDDRAHPRIIVVGQSPKIVQALEPEFIWRGWIPVVVDDLDTAVEAIECEALSVVVVPRRR